MLQATRPSPARVRSLGAVLAVALAIVASGCMAEQERTFFDRTNSYRASQGIRTLHEHGDLNKKAEAWAQRMASTGRLEHSNLTSGLSHLPWKALGENVGYSSPTSNTLLSLHNAFVNSTQHRKNLLDRRFTHMGVGAATDSRGRVWVVEVFAAF